MMPEDVERVTGSDVFVFFGALISALGILPAWRLLCDWWHRFRRK